MKYVKMLGLAAVAAMALMAFIGASSASATVLCSEPNLTENCSASGRDYPANTNVEASLTGTAKLETLGGTLLDTCTSGTVKGKTTTTGGATSTVDGFIEELTWGSAGTACTKTTDSQHNENPLTEGTFGLLEIHWISGTDNGTVTGKNAKVTVNTIFGSCIYGTGAEKDLGEIVGGNPATLAINTTVKKQGGNAACPEETRWVANYTVTGPKPLYIAKN